MRQVAIGWGLLGIVTASVLACGGKEDSPASGSAGGVTQNGQGGHQSQSGGSRAVASNAGATSQRGNAGATSQGANAGATSQGANAGATSQGANAGATSQGANAGATSQGGNVGATSQGGNVGATSQGGNAGAPSQGGKSGGGNQGGAGTGGVTVSNSNTGTIAVSVPLVTNKLDLLLMIDNSLAMGDKQAVLAAAVPQLLRRLTNPDCVSSDGTVRVVTADATATCAPGLTREFAPIDDIHLGIVTSSLGDFGGNGCPEPGEGSDQAFPDQNDHGWLLGALPRTNLNAPFLSFTSADGANNTAVGTRAQEIHDYVAAVGQVGCGVEMSLESWYRFLIDPKPPIDVTAPGKGPTTRGTAVDQTILQLRSQFLRPDSLVAVLMLSDESDCSLRDTGSYSWLTATSGSPGMWRASSTCATDPNSPCCYSCMADFTAPSSVSADCKALDPTCTYAGGTGMAQGNDPNAANYDNLNTRCIHMKQRFGVDFLFPVTRYSNALTLKTLCPDQTYGDLDCNCTEAKRRGVSCTPGAPVANPLYANLSGSTSTGLNRTDVSSVFFAVVAGVPWQDLATAESLSASATLTYKQATDLDWALFAPPRDDITNPKDPFMIESTTPRKGNNPVTGDALAPPEAPFMTNPINGHEWNTSGNDLEFACIFPLPKSSGGATGARDCALVDYCASAADPAKCNRETASCACAAGGFGSANSPLCQDTTGAYSTYQGWARANPGTRQLQALRAFYEQNALSPNNAIAASICPKDLTPSNANSSGYGYNPVVTSLVNQLSRHAKN